MKRRVMREKNIIHVKKGYVEERVITRKGLFM